MGKRIFFLFLISIGAGFVIALGMVHSGDIKIHNPATDQRCP